MCEYELSVKIFFFLRRNEKSTFEEESIRKYRIKFSFVEFRVMYFPFMYLNFSQFFFILSLNK